MPSLSDLSSYEIPESALAHLPEDERLAQAASAHQAAQQAQSLAKLLREKAAVITDPAERSRVLTEAYDRETEAHGNSKKARLLSSGGFQGAVGGAGIGGAVGVGLGTVVGTVVGGVTSIPTTLLGGLVGGGVGAIHGPWIKLTGGDKGKKAEVVQVSQEAIDTGAVIVDRKTGEAKLRDAEALKRIEERAGAAADQAESLQKQQTGDGIAKRKPRKLEVRSQMQVQQENQQQAKPRKQARKLEVRSGKSQTA